MELSEYSHMNTNVFTCLLKILKANENKKNVAHQNNDTVFFTYFKSYKDMARILKT